MQVEFKAAGPRTREPGPEGEGGAGGIGQVTEKGAPLARMALFVVYGYADKTGGNRAESAAMWNTVKERAGKFRARHRTGMVVLAGDLNAAKWSAVDTDRQEAGMWDRENDAALITWIEGNLKVKDSFREAHPRQYIVYNKRRLHREDQERRQSKARQSHTQGGRNGSLN